MTRPRLWIFCIKLETNRNSLRIHISALKLNILSTLRSASTHLLVRHTIQIHRTNRPKWLSTLYLSLRAYRFAEFFYSWRARLKYVHGRVNSSFNWPYFITLHIHKLRCNQCVVSSAQTRACQVCHNYSANDSRDEATSWREGNRLAKAEVKHQDSWLFANCRQNIVTQSSHDGNT